jgi:hypothetical protein
MKKLLLGFIACSMPAWSCSMVAAPTNVEFKSADAVFVGTVTDITKMPLVRNEKRRMIFTFAVSDTNTAKGNVSGTVRIYGPLNAGCGEDFDFKLGHEYVVFAYLHPAKEWLRKGYVQPGLPKPTDMVFTGISLATDDIAYPRGKKILDELNEILEKQVIENRIDY